MKTASRSERRNSGYIVMTKATDDENWCNFIEGITNVYWGRMKTARALASPSLGFEFCVTLEI